MLKRLLLLLLIPLATLPALAQEIQISNHTSNETYNGAPLYDLTEPIVFVGFPEGPDGSRYTFFWEIFVDGNLVDTGYDADDNSPFTAYSINLVEYFDGLVHELKLDKSVCYFKSSTLRNINVDGVQYFVPAGSNEASVVGCDYDKTQVSILSQVSSNGETFPVTQIFYQAFLGNRKLQNIEIPNTIVSIQDKSFEDCEALKSVVLPDDIFQIGNRSFYRCISLTSVSLSKNLSAIGSSAFLGCSSLKSIEIPKSVTSIGSKAFINCFNLSEFILKTTQKIEIAANILNRKRLVALVGTVDENGHSLSSVTMVEGFGPWMNELRSSTTVYTLPEKFDEARSARGSNSWKIVALPDIKIVDEKSDLDKYSFRIENDINAENIKVEFNGEEYKSKSSGTYLFENLNLSTEYSFQVNYLHPDWGNLVRVFPFSTQGVEVYIYERDRTQSTVSLEVKKSDDPRVSNAIVTFDGKDYNCDDKGMLTIDGLKSNTTYSASARVTFNGQTYLATRDFTTKKLNPQIDVVKVTPTSVTVNPTFTNDDAVIQTSGVWIAGKSYPVKEQTVFNLPIKKELTAYFAINNERSEIKTITLPELKLKTLPARAASKDCAIICCETNMSEEEYGGGFEWRRYDAPDMVPSTFSPCPVANGHMEGRLKGLSQNTYYKYRPYYEDCNGNRTFGEWTAFITADADVYFEPTVYTYNAHSVTKTGATLVGYAIGGSEDVDEQGFEYWPIAGSRATTEVKRVLATGQRMIVNLEDLEPGTRYAVRAFATTRSKTTYGEQHEFETDAEQIEDGIEQPSVEEAEVAPFDIFTLQGVCVRRHTTDLSGLQPGLYIANGRKILVR